MKKKVLFLISLVLMIVCVTGFAACKKGGQQEEEPPRIVYEGTYKAEKVAFSFLGSDYTISLGEGFLGKLLTDDLAVLTLSKGGGLTFDVDLFSIAKFNATGTWAPDEKDEKKIEAVISEQKVTATCDGETVVILYSGVMFTLKK